MRRGPLRRLLTISNPALFTLTLLIALIAIALVVIKFGRFKQYDLFRHAHVPEWGKWLVAACILLLCIWLALAGDLREKDEKRRKQRQCIYCGYDLRASKDRCPECGEPIAWA